MQDFAHYMTDDGHMYGSIWGWFFMLVLLAASVAVIVMAIRYISGNAVQNDRRRETAQDILDRRYAKGEIGKKVYEETKKDIAHRK